MVSSKALKRQLVLASAMVMVVFVALTAATYAWYVANNTVQATTSSIQATTNGFVLQIAAGTTAGSGGADALTAVTEGHGISPASTNDAKTWYVPDEWTEDGTKVINYKNPSVAADGSYTDGGNKYYAYNVAEYNVYTVDATGNADVYLNGIATNGAINLNYSDKSAASMRVGITMQEIGGTEELKLVYAPVAVTGSGNDLNKGNTVEGWTRVDSTTTVSAVTYSHITGMNYTDQNGKNWAASYDSSANSFYIPEDIKSTTVKLASNVSSTGVIMRVYVWMEGTDADCVNNIVHGDTRSYSVAVSLAGIDNNVTP